LNFKNALERENVQCVDDVSNLLNPLFSKLKLIDT